MRNKLFFYIFLFNLIVFSATAQDLSRRDADSMLHALRTAGEDTAHIRLLLRLAEFEMFKPGERKADLDSADGFIRQARALNAVVKSPEDDGYIILEQSYLANEYKDRAKGRQLLEEAIRILDKGNNHFLRGKAYSALAGYFDINNSLEVPDRMRAFKQAIAAFKDGGYIMEEAYAYKMLAETDSSVEGTEQALNQSLSLYNSIHYTQLQGVYDLFASLYIFNGNFPEALKWGLKALKTAETVGDSSMQLCTINNHIAIIYELHRDSVNAIKYFTEALRIAERFDDKQTIYLLTHNIASIYFNLQQPLPARDLLQHIQERYGPPDKGSVITYYQFVSDALKVYTLSKQFQRAEPYYRQLAGIKNEDQFPKNNLSDFYVDILDYLLASGQYIRMLPYLEKDEVVAKAYGNPRNLARLHKLWFSYDTSRRDYKSAVDHMLQYDALYGTIYTQAKDRAIKELQVEFDTKKKEDQIALLNKEAMLEKAHVKQANLVKDFTLCGILLTLVIAGLLFRQNRLKQKNNRIILHKNELLEHLVTEKEWLLKEVHHRVKNNLHTVISLLRSQAAYLKNDALKAIENSQHRIYAMSMIHQRLYQSDDIKTIEISHYLSDLIQYLSDSFGPPANVRIRTHIQPLTLDVAQAVPIGLIINETVTNAFKYAFPFDMHGTITIELSQTGPLVQLMVADNGIGLSHDPVHTNTESLGIKLIMGLARDLKGHVRFETDQGTRITFKFPADPFDTMSMTEYSSVAATSPSQLPHRIPE
ncbi:histidine kinase dimerization/phosphoacceptor domain -containing protein [Flavitalea sp. BT771]|uniref:histidine kinase dimerization/phosphoacceptor domain -containing protein n=1 Tax=Flavitalea sp. BT771 TaxID=3063329 RepID=UPI0026E29EDB|nr:histidine kinase dimerization/phosphoacceptor domain -containing protein [Flavitalea sp. BT771]MDO6429775.1 histidine kinase dimerization/phosphoacceptor domain -containing protein [Flavitalea sp. BT771]MDV6218097.1 histidine kinase dimerization/phosphoacceptor domain -containing protein [Flavitalea sp. BT771]